MSELFITRKIPIPSLTLNQKGLNNFKLILDKTGSSPTFSIETSTEELNFNDFQSFANQNWPTNIKQFTFRTGYTKRRIYGYIDTNNIYGLSNITLEDNDRDWVSARVDELKRFFDQHRNWHYVFQDIKYVIAQGLLLVALLDYWLISYFIERDWNAYLFFPIVATLYGAWYLYGSLLPRVFPFLVLEPERPSFTTKLRNALKYLIPAIFAGLVIQVILSLIPK